MEASEGKDSLFLGVRKGEFDAVKESIESGHASVDERNSAGKTLAHLASANGHTKILKYLIASGCDIHATDLYGNGLVHEAAARSQLDVLILLRSMGARFDLLNHEGKSAESNAKAPHIRKYVEKAAGRGSESFSQQQKVHTRKKPVGIKNKKEYLKWKRERARTRTQNETCSDDFQQEKGLAEEARDQPCCSVDAEWEQSLKAKKQTIDLGAPIILKKDLVEIPSAETKNFEKEINSSNSNSPSSMAQAQEVKKSLKTDMSSFVPRCCLQEVGWSEEGMSLGFPRRPNWQGVVSTGDELNAIEEDAFNEWENTVTSRYGERLSKYERKLEFWRQLWRVMERANICLVIVDARNPLLQFSHALYVHATETMKLKVIIVLNKSDLVSAPALCAWKEYFQRLCPGSGVCSVHSSKGRDSETQKTLLKQILDVRLDSESSGPTVEELLKLSVDTVLDFRESVNFYQEGKCKVTQNNDADAVGTKGVSMTKKERRKNKASSVPGTIHWKQGPNSPHEDALDCVVVCVVGEPNVGKSSLMNALLGVKKMAVSSHPGRTKHYQTYYLTPQLMLCDCPGLIFPKLDVDHAQQVLYGSFPIAQCRDPYSVVGYLAERIWPPLENVLNLVPEDTTEKNNTKNVESDPDRLWSVGDICEAVAVRKKWFVTRGGRPDVYRAANWILRSALSGNGAINLAFWPPANLPHSTENL